MIRKLTSLTVAAVAALMLAATPALAQTAPTTTTLSAALPETGAPGVTNRVFLGSLSNVVVGGELYVDKEALCVTAVDTATTSAYVIRGCDQTPSAAHASAQTVYVAPNGTNAALVQSLLHSQDPPFGTCSAGAQLYTLWINVRTGQKWQCTNDAPGTNGHWLNVVDEYFFAGPANCNSSVSGNSTGTNGLTVLGTAPSIPVIQAQTSSTGTNTHYYTCAIPLPSARLDLSRTAYVADVEFYYGVQTTALGTQVATLASGTLNSKTVFQTIAYPVAAATETATGLAEAARADSGTLTITPVVGSFNTATTTAGEFYTVKFTPANPVPLSVDHTQLMFTVSLLNTATSATVTNSPGFLVHVRRVVGF
jgi:hypothetical protein